MAITRTLHQGEESLLDLTKQICSFLQVKYSCFISSLLRSPYSLCGWNFHDAVPCRELILWVGSVILLVVGTLKTEAVAMLWIELK